MYRGHSAPALCGLEAPIRKRSECNVLIESVRTLALFKCPTFNLQIRLDGKIIDNVKMVCTVLNKCSI